METEINKSLESVLLISIREAARATGLCRGIVEREIREGKLAARVYSRRTLIEVAELRRWMSCLPTKQSRVK